MKSRTETAASNWIGNTTRRLPAIAAAAAVALAAASCDTGTVPIEENEHGEPAEVVLTLGGQEIARADNTEATDEIHVAPDEETGHITIEFVDEDGDVVEFDDDVYLEVDVDDETVAEFEQDTPGEFGGHVHGHAAGETTAVFKLMHGEVGTGHEDWISADVTIHVE